MTRPFPRARPVRLAVVLIASSLLVSACVSEPPQRDVFSFKIADRDLAFSSVARTGREVTVRLRNIGCRDLGTGSGVIIGPDLIVTNRHVVAGARQLEVNTWDGRKFVVSVAEAAEADDLALVRVVSAEQQTPVDLGSSAVLADRDPIEGESVFAVGYPGGNAISVSQGNVLGRGAAGKTGVDALRISAEVRPGNSGGPLLSRDGDVVGVVFAVELATDRGLAVPVSRLAAAIDGDAFETVPPCN